MQLRYRLLLLFTLPAFFPFPLRAQDNLLSQGPGAVSRVEERAGAVILSTPVASVTLQAYRPTVIRVDILRGGAVADSSWAVIREPEGSLRIAGDSRDSLWLTTDSMKVLVLKKPLRLQFYNAAGKWLGGEDASLGVRWQGTEVTDYRRLAQGERFIGLGEKTGPLDRRGRSYVNWNTDAYGYGLNQDPIYSTMPFYLGTHDSCVYGLFFDNTYKSFFNFGASTDGRASFFGAESGPMNYYFFGASTVPGLLRDYTWLTGRMQLPPLWSLGYQQSRYSYMSQRQVLEVARKMRADSIPCDVLYCDIDYMRGYRVFTWNPVTFPNPRAMTDTLRKMGIHLVTIIDPGIKIDSEGYAPYRSGMEDGYFARYPGGSYYTGSVWAGRSHFPDFTRAAVRSWWGDNFRGLVSDGVTGFWNDMNEPSAWGQDIPSLIEFGSATHPATLKKVRNIYGMQMARATYEGTKKLMGGSRPFVLSRAAYSGIQRYSAMWTGDNNPTDDHMLLGFRLINSMGLSGVPFVGMDVGGFTGNPTPDLMVRWMSLGTFTPMFRNHTGKGNTRHEPWAWGETAEPLMRSSIELRYRLLPYLYSTFYEATRDGMPVNRSLAIAHPYDSLVYKPAFEDEFLFGPSMLVAPVASNQAISRVYLPEGADWYRFSSGKKYAGGRAWDVPSPLDDLPVFVKAGAIIPMQSVTQSTAAKGDGILYLHVWYGGKQDSLLYYEDDGRSYAYEKGADYRRLIRFRPGDRSLVLGKVAGSYPSRFKEIRLVLHGFPVLSGLRLDGAAVAVGPPDKGSGVQRCTIRNGSGLLKISWQ